MSEWTKADNIKVIEETLDQIDKDPWLQKNVAECLAKQSFHGANAIITKAWPTVLQRPTVVKVTNNNTIDEALEHISPSYPGRVAILNFADYFLPGGYVREGSFAQEECICRATTLLPILEHPYTRMRFYNKHAGRTNEGGDDLIYTPGVTILKKGAAPYDQLETAQEVDVVTCAAPVNNGNRRERYLYNVFLERFKNIIRATSQNTTVKTLVLGAFGCGAFGNDPKVVARAAYTAVQQLNGLIDQIIFAVYSPDKMSPNYLAFRETIPDGPVFYAAKETEHIIKWIKTFFQETGGKTAVIGLSGGKDSTITAALCAKALGKENVFGVIMPDGDMPDIEFARRAARLYCGDYVVKDIGLVSRSLTCEWYKNGPVEKFEDGSEQARINMPARLRMTCLYWVAQTLGHGRVANTCNLSEDFVGYATRYGDGAGDFAPLGGYTVQEVKAIGRYLEVPKEMVEKIPSDGLQDKTDEDNLGFTYKVLDRYIREGICDDPVTEEKIERLHRLNEFKLRPIPSCGPQ